MPSNDQPNPEREIFVKALDLPSPEERLGYAKGACGDDAVLLERVRALLLAHEQAEGFLPEHPAGTPTVVIVSEQPGDRVGRYKLLQQIGEGGCGVVYMAEQEEPVRRRVALKVIKMGMDTKSVIARFEAERQALALMDHPNIAKVLDAGATETGRPYFVMELVRGIRITDYCDQNNLSVRQRLDLFLQICRAIQHAHQKGIIHRDIKPSNILVTLHDGVPVPKVIDFGIAKATDQRLTDKTLFTKFEALIGTPAYMSPEQAEMSGLDIDTRSDIYALGVLLYELLTGKTPFDATELLEAGLNEMRRIIREKEPIRPSTRLSTMLVADLNSLAQHRQADAPRLVRLLRGDLDWIVMKTLEKDRTRRYETANGLARDIQRHLNSEPVVARPPSNLYRFQRMVRRNKLAFAAASALAVALLMGLGVSSWLFLEERQARHRSMAAEREQSRLRADAQGAQASEAGLRKEAEATGTRLAESLNQIELKRAGELFAADDSSTALAYLALVLRQNPKNHMAAERLIAALTQRSFPLPTVQGLKHNGDVTDAQFSPDGRWVVTASEDKTSRIWDAETGQPQGQPLRHEAEVRLARFSPDGQLLLTVSSNTVRVWVAQSGEPLGISLDHANPVRSAEFSPDGELIVTASGVKVRIWETRTGQPKDLVLRHRETVHSAQFSHDGQKLVTACSDGTARIWDVLTGEPLAKPLAHSGIVVFAQFSPDGQKIITASADRTARIWDTTTGQQLANPLEHKDVVLCAQFSPDGRRVVTASRDGTARIWDPSTGQPLSNPLKHVFHVTFAEFSPDGLKVLSVSEDTTARIWDARTGEPLCEPLRHESIVRHAQFSPDGQRVITASSDLARVWDVRPGQPLPVALRHSYKVDSAQFNTDGQKVLTVSQDTIAHVWSYRTGEQVLELPREGRRPRLVQWSPDGLRAVTASASTARVWNIEDGRPLEPSLEHSADITSLQFSRDGHQVVTASEDGTAQVWDALTCRAVGPPIKHGGKLNHAEFSRDGQRLVTACSDRTVHIWNPLAGKSLVPPIKHDGNVRFALLSPGNTLLLTVFDEHLARIWDARTGQPLTEPFGHDRGITSAEFSPDGQRVVTSSLDASARVWDARSGQPLTEPLRHNGFVNFAGFSPDGKRLVTTSYDKTARIWDAYTGLLLTEPFRHDAEINSAQFSVDGSWLVTASADGFAKIWEIPQAPVPTPGWLPELAEAVAGKRINERGISEKVPVEELLQLKQKLTATLGQDFYPRWIRWFFEDRTFRTISPSSPTTIAECVQRRIAEDTDESLAEAIRLSPTNELALVRLGHNLMRWDPARTPLVYPAIDWLSKRALQLNPQNAEAWLLRADLLVRGNKITDALDAVNRVIALKPKEAEYWNFKGLVLERTNHLDEAYQSYSKAIELAERDAELGVEARTRYRMNRFQLLMQLGRQTEARADFLATIPARDPKTCPNLLDLTAYYNGPLTFPWSSRLQGNDLAALPRGRQILAGVGFDVRGVIQIAGNNRFGRSPKSLEAEAAAPVNLLPNNGRLRETYPDQVAGIKVAQLCRRLHFLHSSSHTIDPTGTPISGYVVHYADGQQREFTVLAGLDVLGLWHYPNQPVHAPNCVMAWEGTNDAVRARRPGMSVRIFKSSWENPLPDLEITTIDYVSKKAASTPFLIAITADNDTEDKSIRPTKPEAQTAKQELRVGGAAPTFKLPLLDGGSLDLSAHRGNNIVILDFWATWCVPCRLSLPVLVDVSSQYKDKGVILYSINAGEEPDTIRDFLKRFELGLNVPLDRDGTVGKLYGVKGIPHMVIIGQDGTVQAIHKRYSEDLKDQLTGKLDSLLLGAARN